MQSALCIGVDVAKDNVVVACSSASFATRTVPNKTAALKTFLQSLGASLVMSVAAWALLHGTTGHLLWRVPLAVAVGAGLYALITRAMKMEEFEHLSAVLRERRVTSVPAVEE